MSDNSTPNGTKIDVNKILVRARVRAGFYRCGSHCIHRGSGRVWGVYEGPEFRAAFGTLDEAHQWSSNNQPGADHDR
jgi:hypothetical protein